jgi:anti-sigma regulatory factor (Ser/Thr protein kinase)
VTDTIRLTIPHQPPYHGVALLVVGGLAARLDLSYENLEDLQLALENVLENGGYAREPQVTVELEVEDGSLAMTVGPLDGEAVKAALEEDGDDRISLGRLLATLVEDVQLKRREDGHWLRLDKNMGTVRGRETSDA